MAPASCETSELMRVLLDDKCEVGRIVCAQDPLPLSLTNGHWGSATVRFAKSLDVQRSQDRDVEHSRFAQVESHLPLAA
jgi:hypothetical protein